MAKKRNPEYKCEICNKTFKRKDYLKSHIKIVHENTKKYECPSCALKFTLKHNLTRHQRSHQTNMMPKCHICNINFKNNRSLNAHKNKFHRKKCQECTYSAASEEALKDHSFCKPCRKHDCEFVTQNERQLLLHVVRCYGYIECSRCRTQFKYINDLGPYDRHVASCTDQ